MTIAPMLAHGGPILPPLGIAYCALGFVIWGIIVLVGGMGSNRWNLGVPLICGGVLIAVAGLAFFDRLARWFG